MGVLLEHCGGRLDPWLAPEQVRVLPVSASHIAAARALADVLDHSSLRVGVDNDSGTLALRVHRAHADGVPFAVILGQREVDAVSATVRERAGENRTLPQNEVADFLVGRCSPPL